VEIQARNSQRTTGAGHLQPDRHLPIAVRQ
jgi:hypothetical protein